MSYSRRASMALLFFALTAFRSVGSADESPRILEVQIENSRRTIRVAPYPAAEQYRIYGTDSLGKPFTEDSTGQFSGYEWTSPATALGASGFYRLEVTPLSPQSILTATVLNRITYGPTPDEIARLANIGADAFIDEQLGPEKIREHLDIDSLTPETGWRYVTATGLGTDRSWLYLYLTMPGEGYIDDIKLVRGTAPEAGPNLIRNGDFEAPLASSDWIIAPNLERSMIVSDASHSGTGALKLVATASGRSDENAIVQRIQPALSTTQLYTVSFWYLPSTTQRSSLTVRLSHHDRTAAPLLATGDSLRTRLNTGTASISDLHEWYLSRAVRSERQLLELLTQFVDNHFTTFYVKSRDYINGRITPALQEFIATDFEFRELSRWREVLMNPNGTFYDLLRISAESPAMVIYLDTVTSKRGSANENYARELMELFTMGVDNGYDQRDIEEMSRAWTGWRVSKLPLARKDDPFAQEVANRNTDPGYWTLRFSSSNHDPTAKIIFPGRTVETRFGPPYDGRRFELRLPARTGPAGMQDGYAIITHLADLPYTQEYLSVKLCQLFVHDNFVHGEYDYTDPDLSPEGALVRDCMKAWESPAADGRKGNLRKVIGVILKSDLFRQQAAARQKVKTPFEFVVSAVRALRAAKAGGGYTSDVNLRETTSALQTLGMRLFYREEPDGWPEFGREWINTSSLVDRMRYAQVILRSSARSADPVALLKLKRPSTQWRDAGAVTDFFVDLLFLGEGKANLALDRAAAVAFLNRNDTGTATSLFSRLDPNSAAYDNRVRSMVAMLMCLPRFQEQ